MPTEPTSAAGTALVHRTFPGKPLVINVLRILHLAGVVGVGAGVLTSRAAPACDLFCLLTLISGAAILLLDWWSNPRFLRQVKGVGMAVKLLLVAWLAADATHRLTLFWVVLALSSALAHAPGKVRNHIMLRRRGG